MNRRGFLMALAGTGALAAFPLDFPLSQKIVVQGYKPDRWDEAGFTSMEIRVGRYVSERAAEHARRRILQAPMNEFLGEFYPSNPVEQDLPGELGEVGQVIHYRVVAGAAAAKSTMLMGAFRLGPLMWMIDGRNARLDLVTDLATQIADAIDAEGIDRYRTTAALRRLLPTPEAFPVEVKHADADDFTFRFGL